MKIAFLLTNYGSGGAERTVSYLSEYFANKKCEIDIVVLNNKVFYHNSDKVIVITGGIPSERNGFISRAKAIFKRLFFVRKYLRKHKPDVLFCILAETVKYVIGCKKDFALITSERNNPATDTGKIGLLLKKLYFYYADGIVFQTNKAKDFYSAKIQSKSIVIPNAMGNNLIYQIKEIERKKKISAMGRLVPQKDYPTLIKAFKIVYEKHPDYKLEIYGKGILEKELNELTISLDLKNAVVFAGVCPHAILKIADSSCYVLSSLFEGMPNALMEAMAVGLPCVSTDCPNGPAELIENGINGSLVPVGDEKALANAVLKMIEDKDFAESCAKNATKIIETHSIETIAQKYLEFILNIK